MVDHVKMLQRRDTAANWTTINPILEDGEIGLEKDTRLTKIGDGATVWNALPYEQLRAIFNAAGDILVATADNVGGRLAKGVNGQYLTMVSGAPAWQTPPATDLSSTVALDGSRTMTGNQTLAKADPKLLLTDNTSGSTTDRLQMVADTAVQYVQVDDELHITAINGTIASPKILRAGAIYDSGNRVYSASNPPPGGAVNVPGYNCFVWLPATTDQLPLQGATLSSVKGFRFAYQTAAASTSAVAAMVNQVPRLGLHQTAVGTVILEGQCIRVNSSTGTNVFGLGIATSSAGYTQVSSFAGFSVDAPTGDVKAITQSGTNVNIGTLSSVGTQRGSTQAGAATQQTGVPFRISVTAAGVVTFVFNGVTVYTGSAGVDLLPTSLQHNMTVIANQMSVGTPGDLGTGSLVVSYA